MKISRFILLVMIILPLWATPALAQSPVRRVNVPHFNGDIPAAQQAIFWLGQVNSTDNYADVRLGYTDDMLQVDVHIFDRYLWYNDSVPPNPATFSAWDSVSLYLHLDGNQGAAPTPNSYRFRGQLNHWQDRADYQMVDRGNNIDWSSAAIPFSTVSGWRGEGLNSGAEARGWTMTFAIPFASLGLTGPPDAGTVWGLGVTVHDRDDAPGTAIAAKIWPETLIDEKPSTWGQLHFGFPNNYIAPPTVSEQTLTIRRGLNADTVADAHVGGHTNCGDPFNPNFFEGWGDANYAGYTQVNVQNQADVADWPCYSKYYVTFPLTALPANKAIISATFTIYQFGNAGAVGQAQPSLIQAHTIAENWQENNLTWNNGPLAAENIAQTWVYPLDTFPGWPGVPITWNVSAAIAEAYAAGQPLRLALYSADTAYHSGKFFTSSDIDDWDAAGRPTLRVHFGESLGYSLTATPGVRQIEPGGLAAFSIQIQHTGGFTEAVTVQVGKSVPPGLTVTTSPASASIGPPGGAVGVTAADEHAPNSNGGLWYTIPVTAAGGGIEQTTSLRILVGGEQVYLPVMMK